MKRSISADFYVALVLLAAGGVVLNNLLSADLTGPYASPATLPVATVLVLMALSFLLLVGSVRRVPSSGAGADAETPRRPMLPVLAVLGATIAFVFLMPVLGYVGSSALFMVAAGLIFGNRNPLSLLGTAIIAPVVLYLFFEKVMQVFLPVAKVFG